eukprot:GHVH01004992.1.p1 GENE.GHVH01004992.1~~GHVH01004992.1.p1  ORF type:complete len:387 (-),score=50.92 GHVH01004992.1:121-1281(-)
MVSQSKSTSVAYSIENREVVSSLIMDCVKSLFEALCEALLKDIPNSTNVDDSTNIGIYRFIRYNVFWVDLISKVRSLPSTHPPRSTAYPKASECGNLLPLWQLILVHEGVDNSVSEVIQVVPYAEGRSLLRLTRGEFLQPLYPPEVIKSFIHALTHSIMLMHLCGYCHRDVTPTNILLICTNRGKCQDTSRLRVTDAVGRRWAPVLADFESLLPLDLSAAEGGWSLGWNGGTRAFSTPPEAFVPLESPRGPHWGLAWDLWGLGSTCFSLLWGRAPFRGDCHDEIASRISRVVYDDFLSDLLPSDRVKSLSGSAIHCGDNTSPRCLCASDGGLDPSPNSKVITHRQICQICRNDFEVIQREYVDRLLIRGTDERAQWGIERCEEAYW